MEIENRTTWNTQELKKLFNLISKHEGYYPRRTIIYYSKVKGRIGGRGTIGPGWVRIGLPNKSTFYNTKTRESHTKKLEVLEWLYIERIGQVYVHELGHNLRLRHKEMVPSRKININYLKGITIHRMIVKKKPTRIRLKPFIYKGFKIKIYKYPHRITHVTYNTKVIKRNKTIIEVITLYDTKKITFGYRYIFGIYKNNKLVFRRKSKIFMKNNSELKKYIKILINKNEKKW
ncbi:hypothetical protein LCGC14_0755400 [marine sediment metagenome]|uniref:Uncharacterized protein n=1 Tax=marine sediment metagenome TaxID=412755 RepID=A0A0F9QMJ0_9ZZZZ